MAAAALVSRRWVHSEPERGNSAENITIMQWNTLADALSPSSSTTNFIRAPGESLKWENRKDEILKEILRSGADIVCLEEVDHFPDFFQPKLKEVGFEGVFKPKPDSPCLKIEGNSGPDGCAIFYKTEKFSCLDKYEFLLKNQAGEESNQVAILVKLQLRASEQELCVAVTHLKSKAGMTGLRAAQGAHLYAEMRQFCGSLPGVVCGDFNGVPTEPVYSHFKESSDWLESSYFVVRGKEPDMTSWKFRPEKVCKYTIDYIWYTAGKLRVQAVWDIPSEEEIGENALPGWTYPSDHVALCARFSL